MALQEIVSRILFLHRSLNKLRAAVLTLKYSVPTGTCQIGSCLCGRLETSCFQPVYTPYFREERLAARLEVVPFCKNKILGLSLGCLQVQSVYGRKQCL
ncbi:hypothetical protein SAMN02745215_04484 [Desulfitobacterium chlororespirans DSM 11544]|uniref:Uncharacterized protein n=1 Tax=Desulfitobacterium chlororespirans DSM 11544 TaxID=1121395 RepID=A0A1M7URZ5_9FIRM|nr:hypothetical protein SAMN02745215_04484 [Desulfitobacterium chlororespirans DSM 11544]